MYKVSHGIQLNNGNRVHDLRLNIQYDNQILYKFLADTNAKKVKDTEAYLNDLEIEDVNKHIVMDCIDFCFKRNMITKFLLFFNKTIWNKSRIKMNIVFMMQLMIWMIFILPIFLLNKYLNIQLLFDLMILYSIHLLSIVIHESSHSLLYWLFQKEINGYYKVGYCSCSFVYNEQALKAYMKIMIALCGTLFTIIVLLLCTCFFSITTIVFIEIGFQIVSLCIGTDGSIILKVLKTGRNKN